MAKEKKIEHILVQSDAKETILYLEKLNYDAERLPNWGHVHKLQEGVHKRRRCGHYCSVPNNHAKKGVQCSLCGQLVS